MSTSLVVTGGPSEAQYDTRIPRPPLRDGVLEDWLLQQPEYKPAARLWVGENLTGEVFVERDEGGLRSVSVNVSRRGTAASGAEYNELRRRLCELASLLGGRVWDDDEEAFLQ